MKFCNNNFIFDCSNLSIFYSDWKVSPKIDFIESYCNHLYMNKNEHMSLL
jgi:hypothetical protein